MHPSSLMRINLSQAEMLVGETRHVLGLPPPVPMVATRSSARVVPTAASSPEPPVPAREKLWSEYSFQARAKMLIEKPAEAKQLRAQHIAMLVAARADLASTRTYAEYRAVSASLRKLEGALGQ